jgi:hypothetical protein
MKKASFHLETTADSFARLLSQLTRFIYLHRFPPKYGGHGEGYFFLRPLRLPEGRIGERPVTVEIDCSYVTESDNVITVFPEFWAIRFQIVTQAPERIAVTARCSHAPVIGYFDELLREIARRCPESREAIRAQIDEKRVGVKVIVEKGSQASEGQAAKPPPPPVDTLDPLDRKIIEVVNQIERQGLRATDRLVVMRVPLNPRTDRPYHRTTINRRRCALRDMGYKV